MVLCTAYLFKFIQVLEQIHGFSIARIRSTSSCHSALANHCAGEAYTSSIISDSDERDGKMADL